MMLKKNKKRKVLENLGFLMNKRGSAFAVGMTLVMAFLVGYSWWCFSVADNKINAGIASISNITSIYPASERLSFYLEESGKLSVQQAFYEMAKQAAIEGEKCFSKPYGNQNIVQWAEQCKPDNELSKKMFLGEYNKSLASFIKGYPEKTDDLQLSTSFEKNILTATAKKTFLEGQHAAYVKYNLSYDMLAKLETNLAGEQIYLDDFALIYNTCASAFGECKKEADIKQCLEKTTFERWTFGATPAGDWTLFEFRTKRPFFFEENGEEKFSAIELNFGLLR